MKIENPGESERYVDYNGSQGGHYLSAKIQEQEKEEIDNQHFEPCKYNDLHETNIFLKCNYYKQPIFESSRCRHFKPQSF